MSSGNLMIDLLVKNIQDNNSGQTGLAGFDALSNKLKNNTSKVTDTPKTKNIGNIPIPYTPPTGGTLNISLLNDYMNKANAPVITTVKENPPKQKTSANKSDNNSVGIWDKFKTWASASEADRKKIEDEALKLLEDTYDLNNKGALAKETKAIKNVVSSPTKIDTQSDAQLDTQNEAISKNEEETTLEDQLKGFLGILSGYSPLGTQAGDSTSISSESNRLNNLLKSISKNYDSLRYDQKYVFDTLKSVLTADFLNKTKEYLKQDKAQLYQDYYNSALGSLTNFPFGTPNIAQQILAANRAKAQLEADNPLANLSKVISDIYNVNTSRGTTESNFANVGKDIRNIAGGLVNNENDRRAKVVSDKNNNIAKIVEALFSGKFSKMVAPTETTTGITATSIPTENQLRDIEEVMRELENKGS